MATVPAPPHAAEADRQPPRNPRGPLVYRHRLATRLWHWFNVATLTVLLMSGLMIFNAHGRLYWGRYGANFDQPWLVIGPTADGGGHLQVGRLNIPTTGLLGRWTDRHGQVQTRAFPWWATIPSDYSLSAARRWHLTFAWALLAASLAYWIAGLVHRPLARDLVPARAELRPAHLWHDIKQHARLRLPTGEQATRYNTLQKLAYLSVVAVMLPLMILTGIAMSPWLDADLPGLLVVLGGRQSARSLHFLCAWGLVGFTAVHLAMVVLAGPVNELRSMLTGWFRVPRGRD